MGDTRDDFSKETIRTLGERVGLLCSKPDCRVPTKGAHTDHAKALSVGVAAHICAAAPGGPRYDETQTPEERSAIANGVWLCATCAALVDKDPNRFPPEILRGWKEHSEREASQRIGKPSAPPRETTVVDHLRAIPAGAIARLSYYPRDRQFPHEVSVTVEGVDDGANVFRFKMRMGPHPESSYGIPLGDVDDTWCPDGTHHVRVSGYFDHSPLEPYRYVCRATPRQLPTPPAPSAETGMSAAATEVMIRLARMYVEAGFPGHKVWSFRFPLGDRVAAELRARGLLTAFGSRGIGDRAWRLTDAGHRWIMRHEATGGDFQ